MRNQIVTDLSPNKWVYEDLTTFVITHKEHISSEKIRFVSTNPVNLIEKLKIENGKGIWICGGANIVQQLVNKDLIVCYYITVIPTDLQKSTNVDDVNWHPWSLCRIRPESGFSFFTDL